MPAKSPKFDRSPGRAAAVVPQPPRVFARIDVPETPERPERITLPEPYPLGQRVECGGFRLGKVFNVCPCVCSLRGGYVYTVELDVMFRNTWFFIGHSSEVDPI